VDLVLEQKALQPAEVLDEFLAVLDALVVERLEGEQRIAQQLLGTKCRSHNVVKLQAVRILDKRPAAPAGGSPRTVLSRSRYPRREWTRTSISLIPASWAARQRSPHTMRKRSALVGTGSTSRSGS